MRPLLSEETELLYLKGIEGSYLRETEVNVLGYEEGGYILDRTIMHYQGGGQPGDRGFLLSGSKKILIHNVRKKGKKVVHLAESKSDVKNGKLIVEWERRYRIMRMHTLQHAISASIFRDGFPSLVTEVYPGYGFIESDRNVSKIGDETYKLNENNRRVRRYDINRREIDPKLLARCNLEKLPRSLTTVSMVEIDDLDLCACAGTHVRNTSEIGKYWLRNPGKKIEFGLF